MRHTPSWWKRLKALALPQKRHPVSEQLRMDLLRIVIKTMLWAGVPFNAFININTAYEVWIKHTTKPILYYNNAIALFFIYVVAYFLLKYDKLRTSLGSIILAVVTSSLVSTYVRHEAVDFAGTLAIFALPSLFLLVHQVVLLTFVVSAILFTLIRIDPMMNTSGLTEIYFWVIGLAFSFASGGFAIRKVFDRFALTVDSQETVTVERTMLREHNKHLQTIANQAGKLETTNRHLQALIIQSDDLLVEQERNRMARDIHDGLGRHLNNVDVQIRRAWRAFDSHPSISREALEAAYKQVAETQNQLQLAIDALVSLDQQATSLEDLLLEGLEDCRLAGVIPSLEVIGTPRKLPDIVKHSLHRIGQEALVNVRKHSNARRVELTLNYDDPEHIQMIIQDDGEGIPESVQRRKGHGLDNLFVRAELAQGFTAIQSESGLGVRIMTEIPTNEPEDQADAGGRRSTLSERYEAIAGII